MIVFDELQFFDYLLRCQQVLLVRLGKLVSWVLKVLSVLPVQLVTLV